MLDIRQEDFLQNPKGHLLTICEFLGLEPEEVYLEDCASIVYKSPHRSRHKVSWEPDLIAEVAHRMTDFHFLERYSFES
jgi:hypothetical protein